MLSASQCERHHPSSQLGYSSSRDAQERKAIWKGSSLWSKHVSAPFPSTHKCRAAEATSRAILFSDQYQASELHKWMITEWYFYSFRMSCLVLARVCRRVLCPICCFQCSLKGSTAVCTTAAEVSRVVLQPSALMTWSGCAHLHRRLTLFDKGSSDNTLSS